MKPKQQPLLKKARCNITFIKGVKHVEIEVTTDSLEDWIDKHKLLEFINLHERTLQTMRTNKEIPYSRLGRKILYYKPGILTILAENLLC